ncbi:MAG: hypothetical protein OQK35_01325 [Alphaproteobacteria bacterium]|nr:hypothetical protein [Rhodospirillales bacterium]MCW9044951.1 hypothetical protein [Alphaproteobacteria bacterium]
MAAKKDIEIVEKQFKKFLEKSLPLIVGKNGKEVTKHLNKLLQEVSDGKSKDIIKRVEKEFGVSLAKQYKEIEKSEKARWGRKLFR